MPLFILLFLTLTLLIDTILLTMFATKMGLILIIPACILYLFITNKLKNDKDVSQPITGFDIGEGIDIDNPETPENVKIVLDIKSLLLGFIGIAGPGGGKTIASIGILSYFTKTMKYGWIYWEGKGDIDIYQTAMSCGTNPHKFFSSELPHSDTTNVISGSSESVIDRLTAVLIVTDSDYYKNAQRSALAAVIPLLKSVGKTINLRDLYVILKKDEAAMYVMNMAIEQGVSSDIVEFSRDFFNKEKDSRLKDIDGLLSRLSLFVNGSIAERINAYEPTLDLSYAAENNLRVYIHLPLSHIAKDIAIMFTEQIGEIAKKRQLYDKCRTPFIQIFDDWGAFFYNNFGPITARCRSAAMPCSFLFQSKGQTDRVETGGSFTTEITDNIGSIFAFRLNGFGSASWAANQFGTFESNELQVNENTKSSGQGLSTHEKARVSPDDLMDLDAGEAYFSTLIYGEKGRAQRKRYKARFPHPDISTAEEYDWPIIEKGKHNNDCEGLHLWRDFMDRDRLKDLKKEVIEAINTPDNQDEPTTDDELDEVDFI